MRLWGGQGKGTDTNKGPYSRCQDILSSRGVHTHSLVVSFEGQSDDETTKTRIRITSRVRVFGLKFNVLHESEGLQTNSYQPVNRFDRRSRKKSRSACGNKWIRCSTTNMFWAPQQICYMLGNKYVLCWATNMLCAGNKYVMCWAACRQLNTVPDKIRATDINPSHFLPAQRKYCYCCCICCWILLIPSQTFQNIFKLKEKPEWCVE